MRLPAHAPPCPLGRVGDGPQPARRAPSQWSYGLEQPIAWQLVERHPAS
eukprot:COSAG01_NODE_3126_length_6545_cov_7.559572_6_plen_49_part_00